MTQRPADVPPDGCKHDSWYRERGDWCADCDAMECPLCGCIGCRCGQPTAAPSAAPSPAPDDALDAARYRWLRDTVCEFRAGRVEVVEFIAPIAYGESIDVAIDEAIAEQAKERT